MVSRAKEAESQGFSSRPTLASEAMPRWGMANVGVQTGNIVYKTDRAHGLHFMAWRAAYAMESDKHNGFENSIC